MTTSQKASKLRIALMSLLTAIIATFHVNFLFTNSTAVGVGFLLVLGLMIYKSNKIGTKELVKHFQYKTLSILSFLLPVSAILYTMIFAGKAVSSAGSEAEQAGAAVGSVIGGGVVTFFAFIFGLSLGIAFYMLGRKSKET